MNKDTLQNYLEAAPFFLFVGIARLLPRLWALKLGRQLGRISRFFNPDVLLLRGTTCAGRIPIKTLYGLRP